MKANLIKLTVFLFILISCQKIERNNPFDPKSPKENWTPVNFQAVQEGSTVKLTWNQNHTNISGFKLSKQIDSGVLTDLPSQVPNSSQYVDASLIGGKLHTYTITTYAGSNQSNMITTQITPILTAGIITTAVIAVSPNAAQSGGTITTDGGAPITARGICWSTTQNPTINNSKSTDGAGIGAFASSLTILTPGITYHIRAYATNRVGTVYGNELIFTFPTFPTLSTTTVSSITSVTAISGGNIISDGGGTITARGVCWSIIPGPTINGSKTTSGIGSGSFTSNITGLTAGSYYYLRSYAISIAGTAYGNEITFYTSGASTTVLDADGNIYNTLTIGNQVWMGSNLKTTKYNDNTTIPLVTDNTTWANLSTSGYCWYNNDATTYKGAYGALYNWYTVSTGKLCPTGWHVPTDAEWTILTNYLGGLGVAAGKLKETGLDHWASPNSDATNSTGFTGLPGGHRYQNFSQVFESVNYGGFWWSATSYNTTSAWVKIMINAYSTLSDRNAYSKQSGSSVRCMKN